MHTLLSNAITVNEFVAIVSQRVGAFMLTFETRTDARAKKTGNPFGVITKTNVVNGTVNFRYDAGVLRRLEKEGKSPEDFERGESWHEAVTDSSGRLTPFCRHKQNGDLYIRFMHNQTIGEPRYFAEDGHEITKEECQAWLPKPSAYANQGLEKPLVFLTYKLASIEAVTLNGERFELQHEEVQ